MKYSDAKKLAAIANSRILGNHEDVKWLIAQVEKLEEEVRNLIDENAIVQQALTDMEEK